MEQATELTWTDVKESPGLVDDVSVCEAEGCSRPIGFYLEVPYGQDYEAIRFNAPWEFPSQKGTYFCEECAQGEEGFTLELEGDSWFYISVTRQPSDGCYVAMLYTVGWDHGITWERELPATATLGESIAQAHAEIKTIVDGMVAAEAQLEEEHEPSPMRDD